MPRFSREQMQEAVAGVHRDGLSATSKRMGIKESTIERWVDLELVEPTSDNGLGVDIHESTEYLDDATDGGSTELPPATEVAIPEPVTRAPEPDPIWLTPDGFTVWRKPTGTLITLNDEEATVEMAESLGWKRA